MRTKRYISILLFLLIACAVKAQNETRLYESALEAYEYGLFEEADSLLRDSVNTFKGESQINAYRLLALCNLNMDRPEVAEAWVTRLLSVDPYYRVYNDVPRYAEMVERIKRGKTLTITTASSQAESLNEVPVPVTLITEQMIKDCGADNLRDVLATYVPGMNIIEGNSEMNITMHGLYSSRQEKMLIMINGHRLNGRSSNAQAPDYGISLDKIKQIEVLRGPASSLYGNVALTAVVNIIVKEGRDIDGSELTASAGSFSTYRAGGLLGYNRLGVDLIMWASVYNSEGERYYYTPSSTNVWRLYSLDGYATVQGFNYKPSYDVGAVFKWNDSWSLYSNLKYCKMTPNHTFTVASLTAPSTYEAYRRLDGQKPGHGRTTWHNDLNFKQQWGKWQVDASAYLDIDEYKDYDIVGDSLPGITVPLPPTEFLSQIVLKNGSYQRTKWNDYTYGMTMKTDYGYKMSRFGEGDLLFGVQWERYSLYSSDLILGDQFDRILASQAERATQITFGHETLFSGYAQLKHVFSRRWILNAGMRFDYKVRFNETSQTAFSPRMALIYSPNVWSFKLSYSRSFVDAPYLYRASTIASYRGGVDLKPEIMNAVQLSAIYANPNSPFSYDGNVFYDLLTDLIYYDKGADRDQPAYQNAGSLNLFGVENVLAYTSNKFRGHLNVTYMQVIDATKYSTTGKRVNSIPSLTANMVLSKSIIQRNRQSVWATMKLAYASEQVMSVDSFRDGAPFKDEEYKLAATLIPDLSLNYNIANWNLCLQCKNVFDQYYTRGTLYKIDVPQLGRQWSLTAKLKLK